MITTKTIRPIAESVEYTLVEALPTLQTVDAENLFINNPETRWTERIIEVVGNAPVIKLRVEASSRDAYEFNTRDERILDDTGKAVGTRRVLVADFYIARTRIAKVTKAIGLVDEIILECQNKYLTSDGTTLRTYNVYLSDLFTNRGEPIVRPNPVAVQDSEVKGYFAASVLNTPRATAFVNLLRELSTEKVAQIQARKGRGNAARGVRVKDRIDSLSPEDKDFVKEWFYNNVEQIVYHIPAGSVEDVFDEYDDPRPLERINDKFLTLQQSIFDKLNLNHLTPSDAYTSADDQMIGHNVYLTWRAVTEHSVEKTLARYETHWGNSCKIYFNKGVDIANAPEVISELFKTAKAENPEATGAIKGSVLSSLPLGNALIVDLFADINFLAGRPEVACKREAIQVQTKSVATSDDYEEIAETDPLGQDFPDPVDYEDIE